MLFSFDNCLTSSLTSSVITFISDFISLCKSFMNIKNNKDLSTHP